MPNTAMNRSQGMLAAVAGRIVTMDDAGTVLDQGVLYLKDGDIVAVQSSQQAAPDGFANVPRVDTQGTIYPGLIELHNHLPYNVLQLWQVPRRFDRREQWGNHEDKRRLITAPMRVLGETDGLIQAVVRYVECKALVAGTTTSQGITLFSAPGSQRFYRGIVRNVEDTIDNQRLPEARAKVSDVDPDDVQSFFDRLRNSSCFLLHLAEGVDDIARRHFERLQLPSGAWAVTAQLAGIHSLGLQSPDHAIYGQNQGAIVWSPLSNMLLYGSTLNLRSVKDNGIRLGLGSDWSPSGSKNLFGEMKVARIVSQTQGGVFSDREIVAMATRQAANILGWDAALGSLQQGKYADYLVVDGHTGDPYEKLLTSAESSISLVAIEGVPRFGLPALMNQFGGGTETIRITGGERVLNLAQETADPVVAQLTLAAARDKLKDGFANLANLGRGFARHMRTLATATEAEANELRPEWMILLDNDQLDQSRALSTPGGPMRSMAVSSADIETATREAEGVIELDDLTVADDSTFFERLRSQLNLDNSVKDGLQALFASSHNGTTTTHPEVSMSISFEPYLDNAFQGKSLPEILAASPAALLGVSQADAAHLRDAFGIETIEQFATNRFFEIARAMLAAQNRGFDAGPPAKYEALFANAPDLGALRPDRFREQFGPVMYRGRLDGSARILLVGQDPSTDETLARRAFVGFSGQRVQQLLRKIGITRSYIMVNTFYFGIHGQYDNEMKTISESDPLLSYRNELLDTLEEDNHFEAIIGIGAAARDAIDSWPRSANYTVVELVHPSAPVAMVLPNWNNHLAGLAAAIRAEVAPDLTNYAQDWRPEDAIDIPRFDLPFGTPSWHGAGGQTRSHRDGQQRICWEAP